MQSRNTYLDANEGERRPKKDEERKRKVRNERRHALRENVNWMAQKTKLRVLGAEGDE